jgi:hypothetical protein
MTSTDTSCIFFKQLDHDEIIEILDQSKAPEWHSAMLAANIDILAMSYEESVLYFKRLEHLGKIWRTNGPSPMLYVDNKESITSSICVGKYIESSKKWCHFCD